MAAGSDRSGEEIDRIAADYFAVLGDDLAGTPFNKAEHNRALQDRIDRGRGSIEFKRQNISAVKLWGWGSRGSPVTSRRRIFWNALVDGVLRWLGTHPGWPEP